MDSANRRFWIIGLLVLVQTTLCPALQAASGPEAWEHWRSHDVGSTARMDHTAWDRFLKQYVVTDTPSGINLLPYAKVSAADRKNLDDYVARMEGVTVTGLRRPEQKAYWINLYNALTVKVILDHYPVKSIRDIDISFGLFARGPWKAKLLRIEGVEVALDDLEHRILRPLWEDNRVHYAVNCASMGCPNLQPEAFTAANSERLLEKGAREYINHPRGADLEGKRLTLSSIYDWFQVDFGDSKQGVLDHLRKYAENPLAEQLQNFKGKIRYDYDWSLNE